MHIELVYISDSVEFIQKYDVPVGTNIENAILVSTLLVNFPDLRLDENSVGIFGQVVSLKTVLHDGDRIEVYKPLLMDPMEARRLRAEQNTDESKPMD